MMKIAKIVSSVTAFICGQRHSEPAVASSDCFTDDVYEPAPRPANFPPPMRTDDPRLDPIRTSLNSNKSAEAIQMIDNMLLTNSAEPHLWFLRGLADLDLHRYAEVRRDFDHCVKAMFDSHFNERSTCDTAFWQAVADRMEAREQTRC